MRSAALTLGIGLVAGCAALGDPYPGLGASQDAVNRRINAQYAPGLPQKLPTDYEDRGRAVLAEERQSEWKSFVDLFRWHPAKVEPKPDRDWCIGPDESLSCSQVRGCQCRTRTPAAPDATSR